MSLEALHNELAEDQAAQIRELDEAGPTPTNRLTPQLLALMQELIGEPLLTEAALNWVRHKRRELQGAALQVLYTPEEIEAMLARQEQDEST